MGIQSLGISFAEIRARLEAQQAEEARVAAELAKCDNPENANYVAEGRKCRDRKPEVVEPFCAARGRVKSDRTCDATAIGTSMYERLSASFCAANKNDNWCRCYNNIVGVCETDPSAGGCSTTQVEHDLIVKDLPDSKSGTLARHALDARKHCLGRVCANSSDTYIPEQRPDCALNLDFCIQEVNIGGNLVGSGIEMDCSIQQGGGQQDGETSQGPAEAPEDTIKDYEEKKLLTYGAGGTTVLSSSVLCICVLIIAALSLGGNANA